jgi:hypothetical protein
MRTERSIFAGGLVAFACGATGCAALTGWFTSTSSEFKPSTPDTLLRRISADSDAPNGQVDHFAVLIGANTELRHQGNLSMAYQVLLEQGYSRDKIFVLDSEGATPFFPITDLTTRASVIKLFEHLSKVVESHDTLFVYVTGHGRRVAADRDDNGMRTTLGVSTLVLNPGEEMAQDEFTGMLENIYPQVGVVFFDNCYFGQVVNPRLCNYVFITTADSDTTSNGNTFPRAFWSAFRGRRTDNPPTVFEAFKYAMVADRATRLGFNRPRISQSCVDPSELSLSGGIVRRPTPGEVPEVVSSKR